ncbi:MAG: AAA family ATPase, partial [Promethearchaeota archaeon]
MKPIKNIYLSSAQSRSGKTEIGVGLGMILKEKGYKVAYYKPFGIKKGKEHIDPEVSILAKIFDQDEAGLCGEYIDPLYFETFKKSSKEEIKMRIVDAYKQIKENVDVVIIEGTQKISQLMAFDLDDSILAKLFDNSQILAVNKLTNDLDISDILMQKDLIAYRGSEYLGCILNQVPKIMLSRVEEEFLPFLSDKGINVL